MPNPLPRPEPTAPTYYDRYGEPWSEYVRKIEFIDRDPSTPDAAPVHVLSAPVLFDGVMAPCQISKEGITIDLGGPGPTIVTLWVHEDDVQIGNETTPHLLGGRHVCTPIGEGWDWVPVDPEDDDNPWMAVALYVAEVHVR